MLAISEVALHQAKGAVGVSMSRNFLGSGATSPTALPEDGVLFRAAGHAHPRRPRPLEHAR
eukprot:2004217-Alexandrium_andersonii.AAC.1